MEGAGNRILVVDQRNGTGIPPAADALRRLGDPATGPGFDQLMWVGPAKDASMIASYRVFNADGSEVEQCGNGVRCIVRMLAAESGAARNFVLESPVGPVEARALDDGQIAVNMGPPRFEPADIPFVAERESAHYTLNVAGKAYEIAALSMGNPHCVLEVDDVLTADVRRLGPLIERHERFPERVNVGFMHSLGRTHIALRVHERGVGETLACGTGACAAVVAGRRAGRLDGDVVVDLPGGQLMVSWRGASEPVWLIGPATFISEGTIDL
jgi:diaminopimelate epimerase